MQVLPVDLESVIAIIMGTSIVLIPVAGLTARFALKPVVEAFARLFEHKGLEDTVAILERRMSLLETQMEAMGGSLDRIADAVEFDRELRVGHASPKLTEGADAHQPAPGATDHAPSTAAAPESAS